MTNSQDPFKDASSMFLDWFTAQPGTTFHPSLQITDLRDIDAGRGIIATSDIPADTDLFTIPRNAIISVETSDLAKKLPELFDDKTQINGEHENDNDNNDDDEITPSDLPSSWLNLILILLYESLQGSTSRWHPYLHILPSTTSSFNTLMFWTDEELSALQASAIPSKIGRDTATNMFRSQILSVVKSHTDVFYGPNNDPNSHLSDEDLLQRCHIIGSLIMSYAFDLQPDEDDDNDSDTNEDPNNDGWTEDNTKPPLMGMVPMADMLNADAEFNAHLSHGEDALTMTSLRPIKAGEEVLNYYGPLPNAELARRYGYTSPKHARYDVVEVNWDLVRSCIVDEASQISTDHKTNPTETSSKLTALLKEIEEDEDRQDTLESFIIDRDSGDPNEQGLCLHEAKFEKFPEELIDVISEILSSLLEFLSEKRKTGIAGETGTKELKRRTISTLKRIVEKRAAQYGTGIEQDEEILANGGVKGRMKMAIDVRLGEKKVLKEAHDWTIEMGRKYAPVPDVEASSSSKKNGSKSNGLPPAKRQKRGR